MTELIFKPSAWRTVEYTNLQDVILYRLGKPYNIMTNETLAQTQTCLKKIIFPSVSPEQQSIIDEFIANGTGTDILDIIMSYMSLQGWIDAGEYMIDLF
jgi:hypothetical protein